MRSEVDFMGTFDWGALMALIEAELKEVDAVIMEQVPSRTRFRSS